MLALLAACSSDDEAPPRVLPESDAAVVGNEAGAPDDAGQPAADAADAAVVDPCASMAAVCPTTTAAANGGVVAIDRCAFPLDATTTMPLGNIAPRATMKDVLADLNRMGVPLAASAVPGTPAGVSLALKWADDDETVATWTPQGITGSADADPTGLVEGRRVLLVSWYYTPPTGETYEKGVRVAFVDVTDPSAPVYRFALLVTPTSATSFGPVNLHAGGLVWIGNLLYVVSTTGGFRVFDLSQMMVGTTDVDQIGCDSTVCRSGLYKYFIPEIGRYTQKSACAMLFSSASLDRSTTPPSIVSSEYCGTTACSDPLAGRAYRWSLDASNRLGTGRVWPSEAVLLGQTQVQGTAGRKGVFYMSSSAPAAGGGALYRAVTGKSVTSGWLDAPEDLMVDEPNQVLWTLSETNGARVVAGMRLASYPAP